MRLRITLPILATVVAILAPAVPAQEYLDPSETGIDEKLGEYIPLDLVFVDEAGDSVSLRTLVDRPTIITPVSYT